MAKPRRKVAGLQTSIRISPALVQRLRKRADTLGIGYQTLLKMLLERYAESDV